MVLEGICQHNEFARETKKAQEIQDFYGRILTERHSNFDIHQNLPKDSRESQVADGRTIFRPDGVYYIFFDSAPKKLEASSLWMWPSFPVILGLPK